MIDFIKKEHRAVFRDASGNRIQRPQEIRTDPVSLLQHRITPSRSLEAERGTEKLYSPPAPDLDSANCPFCPENREAMTPRLDPDIFTEPRMIRNRSVLFPNLFPYTEWSAVSLFGDTHHVEIGTARPDTYRDSFINCSQYLARVKQADPGAVFLSITQNHLPGAGGSLVHPHLQVHGTRQASNRHRHLLDRCRAHRERYGIDLLPDLVLAEKKAGERYLGSTGSWEWTAAFAPSGFYEIWGICPTRNSLLIPDETGIWQDLAQGIIQTQQYYRHLNRNAYNLALLSVEDHAHAPCLRVRLTARSSYAPWVRSDFTGFEFASGEMATFSLPEAVAAEARPFWYPPKED